MALCSICIEDLKLPVCLPCGHIFCNECIIRAVNAIKPYSVVHYCPTCRSSYSVVNIDPSLVPAHLRPHVIPSIRRLYLDEINPHVDKTMPKEAALSECARLSAENNALRVNCGLWRKRAEVHAAATLGLLALARSARDQAAKMKMEKDEMERQISVLKRKAEAEQSLAQFSPSSASSSSVGSPHILTAEFPSISIPHENMLHTLNSPSFSCPPHFGWLTSQEIATLEEPATKRRRMSTPSPSASPVPSRIPEQSTIRRRSPRKHSASIV